MMPLAGVSGIEHGDANILGDGQANEGPRQLKAAREAKGLSLADLTELTGMDRSALSKLETGQRANPTVETLVRYAEAVGKRLVVSLADA